MSSECHQSKQNTEEKKSHEKITTISPLKIEMVNPHMCIMCMCVSIKQTTEKERKKTMEICNGILYSLLFIRERYT